MKDNYHLQALKQELDDIAARMQQAHPEVLDEFNFGEGVKKKLVLTKGWRHIPCTCCAPRTATTRSTR